MLYYCANLHGKQSSMRQSAKYFSCYGNLCLNKKFNFSNAVKKYIPKAEVSMLYKREFTHLPLCFDREKLQMSLDRSLYQYTQY